MEDDTIAALSTPFGRGGIAVIRVSGNQTREILKKITENIPSKIAPRKAYHTFIVEGEKRIDECVVIFFKAPRSYTGEDLAEISTHSNPFLVERVLELIYRNRARAALPGEFTYRAFKNGKMDLVQAESVNELINANSTYYATMKFGNLQGKLSRLVKELKDNLVELAIKIETRIEFEEDQDFEEITMTDELARAAKNLSRLLENSKFNDLLNKGLNVVIVGKVNVGKSSLFNTLLMEERSIISSIPGTTRDFIKEKLYIDGIPVEITDAAGINRETKDDIEAQGIERSLDKVKNSDAVIFMLDATKPLSETDHEIFELIKKKRRIAALNKIDIGAPEVIEEIKTAFKGEDILELSVKQNSGIDKIRDFFKKIIGGIKGKDLEFNVNQRQKVCLQELHDILDRVKEMVNAGSRNAEIIAEEIRSGMKIIGELTGEVTTDEILHRVFSQFCVGK